MALLNPLERPGLPDEWMPLRGDDALNVIAEVHHGLQTGHVLIGRRLFPIARHRGRRDVLLRTLGRDPKLWVVHLTRRTESDSQWPPTRSFHDVAEFVARQNE
jgi:hypothetical protein